MSSTSYSPSSSLPQDESWDSSATALKAPVHNARKAKAKIVRDDWDDEDGDEEVASETVWQKENAKAPMPEVIHSSSQGRGVAAVLPPTEALQGPMRILKRPVKPQPQQADASTTSSPGYKSLADREAAYQEARERIFASSASSPNNSSGSFSGGLPSASVRNTGVSDSQNKVTPSDAPSVSVLRNPHGPMASSSSIAVQKGFGGKRGNRRAGKTTTEEVEK